LPRFECEQYAILSVVSTDQHQVRYNQQMRKKVVVAATAGSALAALVIAVVSCTAPPAQTYGNPNGLLRSNLPGDGGGVSPLLCNGEGGGGGSPTLPDGGCAISFTNDLLPNFVAQNGQTGVGEWDCSSANCHGAKMQAPDVTCSLDAGAGPCVDSLGKITVGGIPYLSAPEGGVPGIVCNLQGTCGNGMPLSPGKPPTDDELCKLQAWIACGAPAN
jgi:hypothetical protein